MPGKDTYPTMEKSGEDCALDRMSQSNVIPVLKVQNLDPPSHVSMAPGFGTHLLESFGLKPQLLSLAQYWWC